MLSGMFNRLSISHAIGRQLILSRAQIQQFVALMFDHSSDPNKFKFTLRDFLISLKEFSGDSAAELYIDEKEAETERKAQEEREAAMRIPGMLKPSQLDDDADL